MKGNGAWLYRILLPLLIVGLFVLSVFDLTRNLQADLRDEAYRTLWETATEKALHIKTAMASRYQLLETTVTFLPAADTAAALPEQIVRHIAALPANGTFDGVYYADASGIARSSGGTLPDCSGEAFYHSAMQGGRGIGHIRSAGTDLFALAVPVWHGGEVAGALIGTVRAETIRAQLQTRLFDDASSFRIMTEEGAILLDGAGAAAYGDDLFALFDPDSIPADTMDTIRQHLRTGVSGTFEAGADGAPVYSVYTRLGMQDWYLIHTVPAETINGGKAFIRDNVLTFGAELVLIAGLWAAMLVLEEKRRTARIRSDRERLQQSEESYRLLNQLSEGIMFEGSHPDGTLRFNHSYADTFGREPVIRCVADLKKENPFIFEKDMAEFQRFAGDMLAHAHTSSAEFRIYDRFHEPRWFRGEYLTALDSDRRPGRFVGKLTDIDSEKRTLQRLAADAERDPLTKLLNRASMEQHVDDYLETEGKTGLHAFLMIDLDDFKQINDTYGHVEGDKLLGEVADRLRALFRTSDFVCRMGGDEFSIFLCNINSVARIGIKAQGLIDAITQIGRRYDTQPRLSVSIGIAIPGRDGTSYASLYRNADAALYRAKHSGKSTYLFCDTPAK